MDFVDERVHSVCFGGTVHVVTESSYRVGTCIRKVDGKSSKGERFYLVRHGKTSERIKTEMCPVPESFQGQSSTYQPSFEGFRCFEHISVDTVGPLPEDNNGYKHLLVAIDDFSRTLLGGCDTTSSFTNSNFNGRTSIGSSAIDMFTRKIPLPSVRNILLAGMRIHSITSLDVALGIALEALKDARKTHHAPRSRKQSSGGGKRRRSTKTCNYCSKVGYDETECRKKMRDEAQKKQKGRNASSRHISIENEEDSMEARSVAATLGCQRGKCTAMWK
ncbi:hypothetical protein ADUPG1_007714 [Aduncisulcus paluster]|uniref:Uncharacterized protein n=1 Tax=Aduncisulcus paluster TaxID=2918883 RepID=A0ABQ5KPE2_9EUKA|nr:hypothetical protein ADUPG1_007714 [Aduncisulcus paluster]